jgi:tetratricopeptide (TPR) repeat protein
MKSTAEFKRRLEKIRRLCDKKQHARAFEETTQLLKHTPDNPQILILWANLLQLQEEEKGPGLEEAKGALQRAVDLDDQSPSAWIELGYYLYALEDDNKAALKCFDEAVALARRLLKEALVGKVKALEDLGRAEEGWQYVEEVVWLQSQNGKAPDSSPFQLIRNLRKALVHDIANSLDQSPEEIVDKVLAQ